jgi:hypothetical protein
MLFTSIISTTGITGIELLEKINIPEIFKFGGQSLIGILTIIYLILKIKKLKK